jgi:hypothetical protein
MKMKMVNENEKSTKMNFLQRIYKAEVIYEPNQKLKIKTSYFIRFFPIFFLVIWIGFVLLLNFILSFGAFVFGFIFLWQYFNIFSFIKELSANSKENLLLVSNKNLLTTKKNTQIFKLDNNHYLQISVKLRKHYININITNGVHEIGKYRLNSTEDLKNVLDGLMEIGELEMIESFNISNGEILQLKPKNKQLQVFSSLKIGQFNNVINILSIPNTANGFQIDENEKLIKTKYNSFQKRDIERIIIKRNRSKIDLFLLLKNKSKKIKIFTHKPKEVVAINDVRRLADLLKKETFFKNIEIEIFN